MAMIVVAEDEFLLGDMLASMLEDNGHEVAVAAHGVAALDMVRSKHPDLLITDFMMPLMTGLELATAVRAEDGFKQMPIILVSGAQGAIGRANPDIFNAVIDKPYDTSRLIRTVEALLKSASPPLD
jgi:CheY-like chemotaxis protein